MIVHLFPKSQFTEEFIDFINNHFDDKQQLFVLYTNKPFKLSSRLYKIENVCDYDEKNVEWLRRTLSNADEIIMHNFGICIKELLLYFFSPAICKKTVWFIWGSDLYCYREKKEKMTDKLVELLRRIIIKRFRVIATLTDGDFLLAKKWYGVNCTNIRLDYCGEKTLRYLEQNFFKDNVTDKAQISILLGNSATKTNRHIEALHILEKFKDEDIKIFTPLSYGDKQYAEYVIEEGKRLFGNKFVPITEFMDRERYYEFLSGMDIGVFNNNRQQGTGNIEALLYYEKKVYISDDTTMWNEWVDKEGYILHKVADLSDENVDSLVSISSDEKANNKKLVLRYYDVDRNIQCWTNVFEMEW